MSVAVPYPLRTHPERKRERQNFDLFRALIAAPGDLSAGVVLPANADLYVSLAGGAVAQTHVATDAYGRDYYVPVLAAAETFHIGRFLRGNTLEAAAGISAGQLSLYIRDGVGKLYKIGEN